MEELKKGEIKREVTGKDTDGGNIVRITLSDDAVMIFKLTKGELKKVFNYLEDNKKETIERIEDHKRIGFNPKHDLFDYLDDEDIVFIKENIVKKV